eukprot:8734240-Alexandrium_andersonii.AAC.1
MGRDPQGRGVCNQPCANPAERARVGAASRRRTTPARPRPPSARRARTQPTPARSSAAPGPAQTLGAPRR